LDDSDYFLVENCWPSSGCHNEMMLLLLLLVFYMMELIVDGMAG
jgi:hypothetical protein